MADVNPATPPLLTAAWTRSRPFYDIFGWDKTTGVPTRETLEKFDLADMADDLEKRGIYAQTTEAAAE